MCLDDVVAETHKCINACPVCYILTPENALQLLSGASIQLGIVDLFVQIAQIGCRMCQLLCNVWDLNQEVEQHIVCGFAIRLTGFTDLPT
jgi:Pyruvate/2-oxoacid:ferredoxin oxidoreductase delta subunit